MFKLMRSSLSRRAALLVASMLFLVRTASADDIRVMTSGAFTAAYLELLPQLERIIKGKVVTAATSMGTGSDSIPSRLERGEAVDVVIVADDALVQLIRDGRVLANSRVELARSGIGMAVRAGAPKPDISTPDALKRTLLQAKSIAYSASVSGLYLSTELFQRLGIADQVLGRAGESIASVSAPWLHAERPRSAFSRSANSCRCRALTMLDRCRRSFRESRCSRPVSRQVPRMWTRRARSSDFWRHPKRLAPSKKLGWSR